MERDGSTLCTLCGNQKRVILFVGMIRSRASILDWSAMIDPKRWQKRPHVARQGRAGDGRERGVPLKSTCCTEELTFSASATCFAPSSPTLLPAAVGNAAQRGVRGGGGAKRCCASAGQCSPNTATRPTSNVAQLTKQHFAGQTLFSSRKKGRVVFFRTK